MSPHKPIRLSTQTATQSATWLGECSHLATRPFIAQVIPCPGNLAWAAEYNCSTSMSIPRRHGYTVSGVSVRFRCIDWQRRCASTEGADAAGSHPGAAQLLPLHLQSCSGSTICCPLYCCALYFGFPCNCYDVMVQLQRCLGMCFPPLRYSVGPLVVKFPRHHQSAVY